MRREFQSQQESVVPIQAIGNDYAVVELILVSYKLEITWDLVAG